MSRKVKSIYSAAMSGLIRVAEITETLDYAKRNVEVVQPDAALKALEEAKTSLFLLAAELGAIRENADNLMRRK